MQQLYKLLLFVGIGCAIWSTVMMTKAKNHIMKIKAVQAPAVVAATGESVEAPPPEEKKDETFIKMYDVDDFSFARLSNGRKAFSSQGVTVFLGECHYLFGYLLEVDYYQAVFWAPPGYNVVRRAFPVDKDKENDYNNWRKTEEHAKDEDERFNNQRQVHDGYSR